MEKLPRGEMMFDKQGLDRPALLDQMDRVLESKHFRNSKRYPMLLRFVVEQTLEGNAEILKERTLGMEVFARPGNYDTNADPIVRVTAGEVRKRLAQYYQDPGHQGEVRIDLPLGGYVPHFSRPGISLPPEQDLPQPVPQPAVAGTAEAIAEKAAEAPAPESVAVATSPQQVAPRGAPLQAWRLGYGWVWTLAGCVLLLAAILGGLVLRRHRVEQQGIASFWQAPLNSSNPFSIVIGVHSLDHRGQELQTESRVDEEQQKPEDMLTSMVRMDMVPISDIVSYSRITDLLTRNNHRYSTLSSASATIAQIRSGPVVLIGGLDNVWTMRLTSHLRYHFEQKGKIVTAIVDSQHPSTVWKFDYLQKRVATTQDYALVASYFDSTIDQRVLVVAGIGMAGTEVAGEFVTSGNGLRNWMNDARLGNQQNVEIVLSAAVIDGKTGPPRVIASAVW